MKIGNNIWKIETIPNFYRILIVTRTGRILEGIVKLVNEKDERSSKRLLWPGCEPESKNLMKIGNNIWKIETIPNFYRILIVTRTGRILEGIVKLVNEKDERSSKRLLWPGCEPESKNLMKIGNNIWKIETIPNFYRILIVTRTGRILEGIVKLVNEKDERSSKRLLWPGCEPESKNLMKIGNKIWKIETIPNFYRILIVTRTGRILEGIVKLVNEKDERSSKRLLWPGCAPESKNLMKIGNNIWKIETIPNLYRIQIVTRTGRILEGIVKLVNEKDERSSKRLLCPGCEPESKNLMKIGNKIWLK